MKTRVTINDIVFYILQTMGIFLVSSAVVTKLLFRVTGQINYNNALVVNAFCIPMLIIGQYLIPLGAQFLFSKNKPSEHYIAGNGLIWLKSGLKYIAPGEIIKLLVCMLPTPLTFPGKLFSWSGLVLFDRTYMVWFKDRHDAIVELQIGFGDIIGYAVCHIITAIPYIVLLLIIYRALWFRRKKELDLMHSENHL